MKILITGSQGMLGREFVRQLGSRRSLAGVPFEVVGWGREDLDITNEQGVMQKVGALKPGAIFNCAAYNNVDKAEDEPEVAHAINGEAVGYLARASAQCGATLVHFSTDYVFDGEKTDGYREEDPPSPISVYGRSKALGEKMVGSIMNDRQKQHPWYVIRTSKLFGPAGTGVTSKKSFPEMMIQIAREKGKVEAVDAEAGSPTYVKDLARATLNLIGVSPSPSPKSPPIKGGEESENSSPLMGEVRRGWNRAPGIYHITNSGSCTWYEYAKAALQYAGLAPVPVIPVGPDHFPRKARRPVHVVLLNTKLPPLRPWQEALREFLQTAT